MISNFISNVHGSIFHSLRSWAEHSVGNWNTLIGIGFALLFIGGIVTYVFQRKMGKTDERTMQIGLKCALIMFSVIVLCDIIFPKEYMWQIFFLFKYSLTFLASAIYLAIRYKKEFI
ncbi:DUF2178 domain-containing protein [Metabacillus sp. GX 13764]|uniref:DUF2178 domain-containing protein n=1 Tax=Metabacillus kandeliae TaxID=2900151 RepID=UPI001E473946|nr:DUF2178 domain-containing protein [Metabacillus kandeliae]MCD7034533.1 DUF2178 domain-containing protein [Metabacillus kandeliae]